MTRTFILNTVKLTVWDNEEKNTSYSIQKNYQDENQEWKETKTFFKEDLMKLKVLIDKALSEEVKEY